MLNEKELKRMEKKPKLEDVKILLKEMSNLKEELRLYNKDFRERVGSTVNFATIPGGYGKGK